jgi:RNA polymerase sigma-70 factor (ECF subfamily)
MSGSSLSTTLLQRVVALEPEAWQKLVQLHGPLVYSRCRRCGLQPADARDLVQEVFHAAIKSIASFRRDVPGASFRAWLWGIARHKLQDHWDGKAKQPQAEGGSDAGHKLDTVPFPMDESSLNAGSVAETAGLLRRALELIRTEFEERTWRAFWRFDIDEQPAAVVAGELGMTPNAVHVAACRVRKRLREEFADLF